MKPAKKLKKLTDRFNKLEARLKLVKAKMRKKRLKNNTNTKTLAFG